ncbi:MAG: PAQR family membrane homeostasis protein TrhA [Micromonosporaceae bacterium]
MSAPPSPVRSSGVRRKAATPDPLGRPRLRGWLHLNGAVVAVVCSAVLIPLAATVSGLAVAAAAVYAFGVSACFGISALYHRRIWGPRGYQWMRRLDHAAIFLLIAGTYTPYCLLLLEPGAATVLLAVVWSGAGLGILLQLAWPDAPRWLSVPIYVALGWTAVVVMPQVLDRGGVTVLVLLLAGGLAYSVGALCYALKRPNPWPHVFGYHELFHAFTLAAAICHHIGVYFALFS